MPASCPRSTRDSSSSTEVASVPRIHCSRLVCTRSRRRLGDARFTSAWPRNSRTRRRAHGSWPRRRSARRGRCRSARGGCGHAPHARSATRGGVAPRAVGSAHNSTGGRSYSPPLGGSCVRRPCRRGHRAGVRAVEPVLENTPRAGTGALLVALARLRSYDDDVRDASELYREAVAEAEDGSLVEAMHRKFCCTLFRLRGAAGGGGRRGEAAAHTASRHGETQLQAEALATKAPSAAALGNQDSGMVAGPALALQHAASTGRFLRQPVFAASASRFCTTTWTVSRRI